MLIFNPHSFFQFQWFYKLEPSSSQFVDSQQSAPNGVRLSLDDPDLSSQLYRRALLVTLNSNTYQSLLSSDQFDEKQHHRLHQPTTNQSSTGHQYDYPANRLETPTDSIYIESFKVFQPDGHYSYASELTVQVDRAALGEYLCVNFGASVHHKSAFIKLKGSLLFKKIFRFFAEFIRAEGSLWLDE